MSPMDVVGDSGGSMDEDESPVSRENDLVRSSDWARFVKDRGFPICSFSFASNSESEPRFRASSACFVRLGIPEPCLQSILGHREVALDAYDRSQWSPIVRYGTGHITGIGTVIEVVDVCR